MKNKNVEKICGCCGKIKIPTNMEESVKRDFVFEQLFNITVKNLKTLDEENFKSNLAEYIDKMSLMFLEKEETEEIDIFLTENNFTYENNLLKCQCGETICKGEKLEQTFKDLKESKKRFCCNCGKEFLYI